MARKKGNGAEQSEAGSDSKPTSEATEENVSEEITDEVVAEEAASEEPIEEEAPEVEEEDEELPKAGAEKADPKQNYDGRGKVKKKMFRIVIDQQDNWDKNNNVQVTDPSDGTQFLIKRGHEVDVPEGVVNNLRESVIEQLYYDDDGNERTRNIPRFAMRVIKEL